MSRGLSTGIETQEKQGYIQYMSQTQTVFALFNINFRFLQISVKNEQIPNKF
jgi:hypothetical protein